MIDEDLKLNDEMIPYSTWDSSNYDVIGWPEGLKFKRFDNYNVSEKKKILNNIMNVSFAYKDQSK